jgi:hypothetical protein
MRGSLAVIPGGPELGQVDRKNLVKVNELPRLAEGKELAFQKRARFLARR